MIFHEHIVNFLCRSYVFHKFLVVRGQPDCEEKQRWRCDRYGPPKRCMASIHILGNSVVQEPEKPHICGEPDATRPYVLKVSIICNVHLMLTVSSKSLRF